MVTKVGDRTKQLTHNSTMHENGEEKVSLIQPSHFSLQEEKGGFEKSFEHTPAKWGILQILMVAINR